MLKENPDLTAVFCVTDHEAKDVYYAASELGLKIPEDISVVGFSNLDFAARMSPPLTTIAQKSVEVGAHAARLVVERVQGKIIGTAPHTIKVPCELIERNSTARCRNT
jgi:LacI family transcriptional regulator